MLKRFFILLVVIVLVLSIAVPVFADSPKSVAAQEESGGMGGVVRPYGQQPDLSSFASGYDLEYHGGPVMHTNKTYAIYWLPAGYTMGATYSTKINQYFMDVAAASGLTTNVYASVTQYYGPTHVNIVNTSTFGGFYIDPYPFPADGCALYSGVKKCLSDAQLRAEINRVITLKGWVKNSSTMFFIFTPYNVGSCFGSSCAFTAFCAYHSYAGALIYANQPFANRKGCSITYATSTSPNGAAIDSTLNVVSHEHAEAITDPRLNAWWDSGTGMENGDLCAWTFGTLTGGSYNQTINGHHYILQREWSNSTSSCVLSGW